jgi:CheY-like chemotaxis protein
MPLVDVPLKIAPKQILVVEDRQEVSKALRMVLAVGGGHRVEIADDGESGLAKFAAGKFDLVITDLQMPKMDGLAMTRHIKQRAPAQPVLLITAHAGSIAEAGGDPSEFDFVLEKPFTLPQLQAALGRFFQATA